MPFSIAPLDNLQQLHMWGSAMYPLPPVTVFYPCFPTPLWRMESSMIVLTTSFATRTEKNHQA